MLYVLIGIQATGKSTWARANAGALQAEVVASDEIRNELEAQGLAAEHEGDRVFAIFEARVARLLDESCNVIAARTLHVADNLHAAHDGIAHGNAPPIHPSLCAIAPSPDDAKPYARMFLTNG